MHSTSCVVNWQSLLDELLGHLVGPVEVSVALVVHQLAGVANLGVNVLDLLEPPKVVFVRDDHGDHFPTIFALTHALDPDTR